MRPTYAIHRNCWPNCWPLIAALLMAALAPAAAVRAQAWGLPEMSPETKACVDCHKVENAGIYQQWGNSKHYRANVGCFECHMAEEGEPDAFKHEGQWIATIVSPKDCSRCHVQEGEEFAHSHHSKGGRILGSLDNVLAEVVEGNRGMITPAFPGWQQRGGRQRLLAVPRQRGQGAAGRQARSGHLAEHGHRAASIPTARKVPARPATAGTRSPPTRPGTPTTAASATWDPIIRRWRSTTNRSTASRSARSRTS